MFLHNVFKSIIYQTSELNPDNIDTITEGGMKETTASWILPLTISYKNGPKLDLVYKEFKKEWFYGGEAENYCITELIPRSSKQFTVKIYGAKIDEEKRLCALLMDDFSATHKVLPYPLHGEKFSAKDYELIVDSIASIHAYFWQSSVLKKYTMPSTGPLIFAHFGSVEAIDIYEKRLGNTLTSYLSTNSQEITRDWKKKIEIINSVWKRLVLQRSGKRNFTLIHGDFHPWNIALPNDKAGNIIILDWETYKKGLGVYDLAFLFIHSNWLFEMDKFSRVALVKSLIKHYCMQLNQANINYSEDNAFADFKLSILLGMFPYIFWNRTKGLHNYFTILDEWECLDSLS